MKKQWQVADIIDLYALLHMDEQERGKGKHATLAQRDRAIYLSDILSKNEESTAQGDDSSTLVRQWLSARRRMLRNDPDMQSLPGTLWRESFGLGRWLLISVGLITGILAAAAFLVYSGKAPLNVSAFWGFFVLVPFLLVLLQLFFFSLRFLQKRILVPGGLSVLTGRFLIRGMHRLQKKLHQNGNAETRLGSSAFIGRVSVALRNSPEQASLLLWPAFILLQWAAVGFNFGVLGTTLAKIVFSDIAFAWQSSLQLSPEIVSQIVRWLALPWSYLPNAYPDLSQIQGSQLIFKEGITHMVTEDLRSWWPFLCLSIFFYGLLPRFLLLILGKQAERRGLERLINTIPEIKRIARRMRQPQLDTTSVSREQKTNLEPPQIIVSPPQSLESEPASLPRHDQYDRLQALADLQSLPEDAPFYAANVSLAFIPEEILEDRPASCLDTLRNLLVSRHPGSSPRIYTYDMYGDKRPDILLSRLLNETENSIPPEQILLIQEAWQPPIREHEVLIRALRKQLGSGSDILILLIGKPNPTNIFTEADPTQIRIWRQKMHALADPNLFVHPLITVNTCNESSSCS